MSRQKFGKNAVGMVLTGFVLFLLVFAGPTNALNLSLTGFAISGNSLSTTATINVASNDRIKFNEIKLNLNGPVDKVCKFSVDGTAISGCEGVTINLLSQTTEFGYGNGFGYGYNYGYGYNQGYSNGAFTYEILLDSNHFISGTYSVSLSTDLGSNEYFSSSESLSITSTNVASSETNAYAGTNSVINSQGLTLDMNSAGSGNVVVTRLNSNPFSGFSIPSIGKFFQIDADQQVLDNMGTTKITVHYNDADVAGIDESTLRLYFWNGATWEVVNGGIDTVANEVWAFTNHFSTWGAFGTAVVEDEEDNDDDGNYGGRRNIITDITGDNETGNSNGEPIDITSENGFFSTITGAVIGTTAGRLSVALVFVLGILGTLLFRRFR